MVEDDRLQVESLRYDRLTTCCGIPDLKSEARSGYGGNLYWMGVFLMIWPRGIRLFSSKKQIASVSRLGVVSLRSTIWHFFSMNVAASHPNHTVFTLHPSHLFLLLFPCTDSSPEHSQVARCDVEPVFSSGPVLEYGRRWGTANYFPFGTRRRCSHRKKLPPTKQLSREDDLFIPSFMNVLPVAACLLYGSSPPGLPIRQPAVKNVFAVNHSVIFLLFASQRLEALISVCLSLREKLFCLTASATAAMVDRRIGLNDLPAPPSMEAPEMSEMQLGHIVGLTAGSWGVEKVDAIGLGYLAPFYQGGNHIKLKSCRLQIAMWLLQKLPAEATQLYDRPLSPPDPDICRTAAPTNAHFTYLNVERLALMSPACPRARTPALKTVHIGLSDKKKTLSGAATIQGISQSPTPHTGPLDERLRWLSADRRSVPLIRIPPTAATAEAAHSVLHSLRPEFREQASDTRVSGLCQTGQTEDPSTDEVEDHLRVSTIPMPVSELTKLILFRTLDFGMSPRKVPSLTGTRSLEPDAEDKYASPMHRASPARRFASIISFAHDRSAQKSPSAIILRCSTSSDSHHRLSSAITERGTETEDPVQAVTSRQLRKETRHAGERVILVHRTTAPACKIAVTKKVFLGAKGALLHLSGLHGESTELLSPNHPTVFFGVIIFYFYGVILPVKSYTNYTDSILYFNDFWPNPPNDLYLKTSQPRAGALSYRYGLCLNRQASRRRGQERRQTCLGTFMRRMIATLGLTVSSDVTAAHLYNNNSHSLKPPTGRHADIIVLRLQSYYRPSSPILTPSGASFRVETYQLPCAASSILDQRLAVCSRSSSTAALGRV
ncbi:uncharacterized protein CLUP02_02352 [Colletotrichum lupini]|uniref:Uncharacterized protein n=1 Tax=Colletotrichum lupini TaxID=145971 RepID=A0A9Q8WA60_9PEZI|nr:uncharacterized protein CLUP02_02352 [Colletotrichum lupini]UQC75696.1 hypothetical protein CLUP02_02352 [Colletotrichum lupini]